MHRGKEHAYKSRCKSKRYQRWQSRITNADQQGEGASHKSDRTAGQESGQLISVSFVASSTMGAEK